MIEYTNWNGEKKTWDPASPMTRHYILVDGWVTDPTNGSYFCERVFHCFGPMIQADLLSATSMADAFRKFMKLHPRHNWAENHPRVVKAPCAWDAPENHVVVMEVL